MADITISTSALVQLIDLLPNPEEVTPVGPAGPIIRGFDWAMLNPQPLPPREAGFALRSRAVKREWGSEANPEGWAMATRAVISAHLDRFTTAGIIIVSGDAEEPVAEVNRSISTMIDEWCGTPPHKGPFPGPWGPLFDSDKMHPANLVVAGAQFQKAADALSSSPFHGVLESAAERLLNEGFSRLAAQP